MVNLEICKNFFQQLIITNIVIKIGKCRKYISFLRC